MESSNRRDSGAHQFFDEDVRSDKLDELMAVNSLLLGRMAWEGVASAYPALLISDHAERLRSAMPADCDRRRNEMSQRCVTQGGKSMPASEPVVEQAYNTGDTNPTPWPEARERLASSGSYWLATVRPDGRPHVVPVLAVWVDDALQFAASPTSRKAKDIARNPQCVVTTSNDGLDLVIEGDATKVHDAARLNRVAEVYEIGRAHV